MNLGLEPPLFVNTDKHHSTHDKQYEHGPRNGEGRWTRIHNIIRQEYQISESATNKEPANTSAESGDKIPIVFRDSVPEIPRTTYGTFSIYKYRAKFIPQVVAYALRKLGTSNAVVFDPFAGYGTVGLVARVYGFSYELWDLNPLLSLIHETAIMPLPRTSTSQLLLETWRKGDQVYVHLRGASYDKDAPDSN